MEEFVKHAINEGYSHYGFTPHSPIPFHSPCNMETFQVDEYLKEFERLKSTYDGTINLYKSMEIDFLGDEWGASIPYFQNLPLDYRLSSIHFIPSQSGEMIDVDGKPDTFIEKMNLYFNNDIQYVVETFYERTIRMIELGGFDILGHFDKIGFNASHYKPGIENETWYQNLINQTIESIFDKDIIVEVNTKAWMPPVNAPEEQIKNYIPRLFPSPSTIATLLRHNVQLVVNSDTHFPSRISSGRKEAFNIIKTIGKRL
ncbi:MAG: PHP domain-containing protein [Muribaculum sp.]|nr:PHP domain-containing protein [Muribaculum sp.]